MVNLNYNVTISGYFNPNSWIYTKTDHTTLLFSEMPAAGNIENNHQHNRSVQLWQDYMMSIRTVLAVNIYFLFPTLLIYYAASALYLRKTVNITGEMHAGFTITRFWSWHLWSVLQTHPNKTSRTYPNQIKTTCQQIIAEEQAGPRTRKSKLTQN